MGQEINTLSNQVYFQPGSGYIPLTVAVLVTVGLLIWFWLDCQKTCSAIGVKPGWAMLTLWCVLGSGLSLIWLYLHCSHVSAAIGVPLLFLAPVLFTTDALVHRLANRVNLLLFIGTFAGVLAAAVEAADFRILWRGLFGSLVAGGVLTLAWVSAQLGMGDVKLGFSLGLALAALAWQSLALATIIAFLSAGLWALFLILVRRATLKSSLALGPWLLMGSVVAIFLG